MAVIFFFCMTALRYTVEIHFTNEYFARGHQVVFQPSLNFFFLEPLVSSWILGRLVSSVFETLS